MVKINIIPKEDFERGYSIQGSLTGTFAEAQEYLRWVLSSNDTDNVSHFKEAVGVFTNKWKLEGITTKYLRSLIDSDYNNKNQKINQLIKKSGFSKIPTKKYFRELRSIKNNTNRIVFGKDANGKTTAINQKTETISRIASVFVSEVLHRITPTDKIREFEKIMNQENFERWGIISNNKPFSSKKRDILLRDDLLEEVRKNEEYNSDSKHFWKAIPTEKCDIKRVDKAIYRYNKKMFWKGQDVNVLNCSKCKHEIRLPIETDRKHELIADIYNIVARDIKDGIYFCSKCNHKRQIGNGWNEESIKTFLGQIYDSVKETGKCIGFEPNEFCQDYRFDKKGIVCYQVRDKIRDFIYKFDLEKKMEVIYNNNLIKIKITKI